MKFLLTSKLLRISALLTLAIALCSCSHLPMRLPGAPGAPENLRAEYQANPLGLEAAAPRFSWEVSDLRRGAVQTAYQIIVSHDGKRLWSSGKVESDQSIQVAYAGPSLESAQRYVWRVRTWDRHGVVSPYSAPAFWEMGLLKPDDWTASWIEVPERRTEKHEVPLGSWIWCPESANGGEYAFFLKTFRPRDGKKLVKALVKVTADDEFRLNINGRLATRNKNWRTLTFENVTDHLGPGSNLIAVQTRDIGGDRGFLFGMKVTYEDGTVDTLLSDDTWLSSAKAGAGWERPGYDASSWEQAAIIAEYGAEPWGLVEDREPPRSECLRKEFDVSSGEVLSARAYVSGLGLYELRMNGQRVGGDTLTPGWTHFPTRVQYQTYDVTDLVRQGHNAVGAVLGSGWWGSRMAGDWRDSRPRLICQIDIAYAGGRTQRILTDGTWTAHPSPILENSLYHGEIYDARLEQAGWDLPGFDDSAWSRVTPFAGDSGRLVAQACPPIRVTKQLEAGAVTEPSPGVYVFDFGQNHAGRCRLSVAGPRGTHVRIRHAEILNPDGTIYTENYRSARVTDTYILKGDGLEVYEPCFTYRGFRYAEVTGYPGVPARDALVSQVLHSSVAPAGSFTCSDTLINQIQHNTIWGQLSNLHSVPTDCPQRDERLGWTGDAQIFAPTACWNMDMARFFTKWMRDITDSQDPDGTVKNINPTLISKPASPGWGDAITVIPWTVYTFYGDTRVIEESYEGMKGWVEYMRRAAVDGVLYEREGYSDWVAVVPSPRKPIGAAYYYYSTKLLARMARAVGRDDDAREYDDLAGRIAGAFNKAYLGEDDNYPQATQTANILPLHFGIVPPAHRAGVVANLVKDISERDFHLSTGFLGTPYLLGTLSENGAHDVAWRVACQRTYPSWGYMVDNGATTIWERWNGNRIDEVGAGMNSFNHFAFGAVGQWFYEALAGINPDPESPGFKHFIVRPRPAEGLSSASATFKSMHGLIESAWTLDGAVFVLDLLIPANTSATVCIPTGKPDSVLEGEQAASEAYGVAYLDYCQGFAVFDVGAGSYHFQASFGD